MQAVVKMPRIEITGETIPAELLDFLKKNYRDVRVFDDGEEYITVTQTDWYRQMKADYSPAQALRNYRRRLRMSRKTLGEKLGMPRRSIAAMERGKFNIDQATAHRLAEVFQTFPERFTATLLSNSSFR